MWNVYNDVFFSRFEMYVKKIHDFRFLRGCAGRKSYYVMALYRVLFIRSLVRHVCGPKFRADGRALTVARTINLLLEGITPCADTRMRSGISRISASSLPAYSLLAVALLLLRAAKIQMVRIVRDSTPLALAKWNFVASSMQINTRHCLRISFDPYPMRETRRMRRGDTTKYLGALLLHLDQSSIFYWKHFSVFDR